MGKGKNLFNYTLSLNKSPAPTCLQVVTTLYPSAKKLNTKELHGDDDDPPLFGV